MNRRARINFGLVLGLVAWPACAQVVVEGTPLAKRVVMIDRASLASPAGRAAARREIRAAAQEVCAEEYPHEGVYLYIRACTAGSYGAAAEQLDKLGTKQTASAARLSITVSAR